VTQVRGRGSAHRRWDRRARAIVLVAAIGLAAFSFVEWRTHPRVGAPELPPTTSAPLMPTVDLDP
jgi:hypothetical protein